MSANCFAAHNDQGLNVRAGQVNCLEPLTALTGSRPNPREIWRKGERNDAGFCLTRSGNLGKTTALAIGISKILKERNSVEPPCNDKS